ncbi:hypothetical protein LX36DRAFT_714805 [Colletotrichum falcatum]|nr:hypothetical protein LX36DRAFT_714805 [Colletotrichum falcatum]
MAPGPGSPAARPRGKRVSAQHTLERVRNNQRRHRARQREYTAALETRLGDAERTVSALEQRIESLQAELRRLRCRGGDGGVHAGQRGASPALPLGGRGAAPDAVFDGETAEAAGLCATLPTLPYSLGEPSFEPRTRAGADTLALADGVGDPWAVSPRTQSPEAAAVPRAPILYDVSCALEPGPAVPPVQFTSTDGILLPAPAALDGSWAHTVLPHFSRHPPFGTGCSLNLSGQQNPRARLASPGSPPPLCLPGHVFRSAAEQLPEAADAGREPPTVPCSQAYALIARRNARNVGPEDVAAWLWSGFRASLRDGEGCRVTTDLLSSLLEFISVA